MAAPTPFVPGYDYTAFQAAHPTTPLPADKIEIDFNALQTTTDDLIENLGLIQRSDGQIANNSVGNDQLKSEVIIGLNAATSWLTATTYAVNDTVYQTNNLYRCLTAHTSGTFATDLAALKWSLIVDFNTYVSAAATSATNAATSASTASTQASNASTSATNAATSASTASTQASNASASASAAATSAALFDTVGVITSSSNAITCNLATNRVFSHTFTENTTFTFSNPAATGTRCAFEIYLTQHATAKTVTWPATVRWSNGVAPTLTTNSAKYVLSFVTIDGGSNYIGTLSAEAYA